MVTNVNIAEGTIQRLKALLREEVEVLARATHADYFGAWDHYSHNSFKMYTVLLTEMLYSTRLIDMKLIRVVR